MGYDLYLVETPEGVEEATVAARKAAITANEVAKARTEEVLARKPDAIRPSPFPTDNDPEPDPELLAIEQERRAAWDALSEAQTDYFRLNIWGMGKCREVMDRYGMLADERPIEAEFPLDSPEPYEEHFDFEGEPITDEARAYEATREQVLRARSPEPGIGWWKLCSNDGWVVTPEECREALARAPECAKVHGPSPSELPGFERAVANLLGLPDHATTEPVEEIAWWPEWLAFLRQAVQYGGFRVW